MQSTSPEFLERWANLYTLTKSIPDDDRFNMLDWASPKDTECGTAACMAGHAALHPWFRSRGLIPEFKQTMNDICMVLNFVVNDFFGVDSWSYTPLDPEICNNILGVNPIYTKIRPAHAARAVILYLERYWSTMDIEQAIQKAEARYDPKWVHEFADWANMRKRSSRLIDNGGY